MSRAEINVTDVVNLLHQVTVDLQAKNARIAELERSRSVGDWPEARKLREAVSRYGFTLVGTYGAFVREALRAFCDSAPPASAPSDDGGKAMAYEAVCRHLGVSSNAIGAIKDLRAQLAERTRQVAQLQDELCDARYARDKAQTELAALKSAPDRSERAVDAELREALLAWIEEATSWPATNADKRLVLIAGRWLAAPLSAEDEYTRAAVAYAEAYMAWHTSYGVKHGDAVTRVHREFLPLYTARHNAAASASVIEESTFDSKAVAPAPADGERVTVYVVEHAGSDALRRCGSHYLPLRDERLLALDARVVREGGGK